MATLARWQRTITTNAGIIVPSASVEVRRESDNGLASLFSDRAGSIAIGNPFTADSEGFAAFHVIGGVYKITATFGSTTRTWRYVGVGTLQELDVEQLTLTDANLPDMPDGTIKGRALGAGTGDPVSLTPAQVQVIYNSIGGSLFGLGRLISVGGVTLNLTAADIGKLVLNVNQTRTVNLPPVGQGQSIAFFHFGTGALTIDTPGTEVIIFPNGSSASSLILSGGAGQEAILTSDGTNWIAFAVETNGARTLATTSQEGVVEYATAAEYRANTPLRGLDNNDVWASADYVGLTNAATIAVDMSAGYNFSLTVNANQTLGNPTNTKNGQTGVILFTQDGTGSRTLAYSANWDFAAGAPPTLSTAPNARDAFFYQVVSSTSILNTGLLKGLA